METFTFTFTEAEAKLIKRQLDLVDGRVQYADNQKDITSIMEQINEELDICEHCDGEGVVTGDADDGEGHIMRGAGYEEKCICQIEE